MKVNPKLLIMMAALSAGAASAATTQTTAGTVITNTATASYTDPAAPTTTVTTTSNEVKTTVLPKPSFDIVYSDNPTTLDGNTYATTPAAKTTANAVPGQKVETTYSAVNYGNVALTVALGKVLGGDAVAADVSYYLASDTGRTNAITSISLPVDDPSTAADEGLVSIVQVITVPAAATPSKVYGASPEGSVVGTGTGTVTASTVGGGTANFSGNGIASGTTVYEDGKTQGTDLQFAKVTLFLPNVDNQPNPTVTPPTTPVKPDGTAYTPVTPTTPVNVPTAAAGPVVPVSPTDPNNPTVPTTVPGYLDGTTPIAAGTLAGDLQKAYPKADPDNGINNDGVGGTNAPDVVTFTNSLKNNSTLADKLQLFPVNPDGTLLTGATFTAGVFTLPGNIKVEFLNPDGTAIPVATGALYPTITSPAGTTAYYKVKVTYPDPDDSLPVSKISVNIGADSLNDSDVVAENPTTGGLTTDEIYPAAAQFGDSTPGTQGAVNTPAPVQTVTPNGTFAGTASPNTTDATAVFPMDLANNGQYSDSFVLSATTTVPGATTGTFVPVKYYDASGALLPTNSAGKYVSPVVAPGTEIVVYAVIDVLSGTATGDYLVSQTAVGNFSTITMNDTNDIVRVSPFGKVGVAKFVAKASTAADSDNVTTPSGVVVNNPTNFTATGLTGAKPGDNISYRIIAKNTYNTVVSAFFLSDAVPTNTTFVSVALTTAPTSPAVTIYKVGTGAWSATAPAADTAGTLPVNTVIYIAVDNDGATGGYAPSPLPSNSSLSADFVVTVK